jgi:hypothetical protein
VDFVNIARGLDPVRRPVVISGYCNNVGTTRTTLWTPGGLYVWPASAQQMRVVSSSASDSASGTGVQQVRIYYLDNDHVPQQEVVTLNGTTPVTTVATNILRINGLYAEAIGSNGSAVGNVSLQNTGGTTTYARIDAGEVRAWQAIFTVPAGFKAYMIDWTISAAHPTTGRVSTFFYETTWDPVQQTNFSFFNRLVRMGAQDNSLRMEAQIPVTFGPKADVQVTALAEAAIYGTTYSAGWLEPA